MRPRPSTQGFSLIELLLVLSIIGIIAGIAIPSFMGQRKRARIIGDAKANASVLRMQLEAHKADLGVYGTTGTYNWTPTAVPAASTSPAPNFLTTGGTTKCNYVLAIGSTGLTYQLTVQDTTNGVSSVYITNQNGSNLYTQN